MEEKVNQPTLPGFAAESSLEGPVGHYASSATQGDSREGVVPAAWCWDPWRFVWVLC